MKIFIDSADLEEIKQAYDWGIVDGITTNPSLLKKAVDKRPNINLEKYINEILMIAVGTPVSLEVTETSAAGMVEQGKKLYNKFNPVASNVYIKIPINPSFKEKDETHFDGIQAIKELSKLNIPTNCTLIFTPEQALLAAKAGASFISPFAGRIDDYIRSNRRINFDKTDYFPKDGMKDPSYKRNLIFEDNGILSGIDLVEKCVTLMKTYNLKTEILAASLRNTRQVREAALVGANISTLPFLVIKDMLKHPKTYEGMNKFTADIVQEYVQLTKN